MRVATPAVSTSRRARWAARLAGAGLATTVAIGVTTSPATAQEAGAPSVAGVTPTTTANGNRCLDVLPLDQVLFDIQPEPGMRFSFADDGDAITTVHTGPQGPLLDFDITGPYAARAVLVQGQAEGTTPPNSNNLFLYDAAAGFPTGIRADQDLHAPQVDSSYLDIATTTICIIRSPYNGGS
ncbi:hypothetical protein ABZ484_34625 [Streptomyces sp. NPDC006393]|uniref:hypothetical protein n=1 Tax=Streptomyces sp. NPDC006393 TaxID=3156763 RepID=UPI0033E3FEF3